MPARCDKSDRIPIVKPDWVPWYLLQVKPNKTKPDTFTHNLPYLQMLNLSFLYSFPWTLDRYVGLTSNENQNRDLWYWHATLDLLKKVIFLKLSMQFVLVLEYVIYHLFQKRYLMRKANTITYIALQPICPV